MPRKKARPAARKAKARQEAGLTAKKKPMHPAIRSAALRRTEDALRTSGVGFAALAARLLGK